MKAYIVDKGRILTIKRVPDDSHYAGKWDIPGGRIGDGEDPLDGVGRETKEETGLDIDVLVPFDVQHFKRDDGQTTTMIIFLCRPVSKEVRLSNEHTEYKWVELDDIKSHPIWLASTSEKLFRYGLDGFVR